ncbi:BOS complex subunit NCLN [Euwallacea fornicatus]|uniref:BOS complex subunit NCLN n=1 Tax=Euwallacea fornicatus TaxID=995702 RepID=UPI00338E39AD
MWLDEVDEISKGYVPYYLLVFLPIFMLISSTNPVSAAHEFPAYRMQHYDLHGVSYGSRAAGINLEARSILTWSTARHCVLTRLKDLTVDIFRNIRGKAGALIVELPESFTNFTQEEKQQYQLLENKMLYEQETSIPVYFTKYNPTLEEIITELSTTVDISNKKKSAFDALFSSIAANGYQIVISSGTPIVKTDTKIATIHGHLTGYRTDGKVPTIAIVTHYDSFGISPDLSYGADANGSGVIIMLELIRLLSGLYADSKTRGKYNIVFVLAGGGKVNFQGSKKWLEEQLDSSEGSLIQDASFVLCLDTLTASDTIFMHVSKPPKEGSSSSIFYRFLKTAGENFSSVAIEGVHKKINLAEDILAWEHERYSIRRLPAFTLSTVKSHKESWRSTILDTKEDLDVDRLVRNARIIVDAIGRYVYDIPEGGIFGGNWDVNPHYVETWLEHLAGQPRSPQLLSSKDNPLVGSLLDNFNKYLRDVKITYALPDKRDPDYQFFGSTDGTVNIYSVKPAVFDLVLTLAITSYLVSVYFAISYIPALYTVCCDVMKNQKVKSR